MRSRASSQRTGSRSRIFANWRRVCPTTGMDHGVPAGLRIGVVALVAVTQEGAGEITGERLDMAVLPGRGIVEHHLVAIAEDRPEVGLAHLSRTDPACLDRCLVHRTPMAEGPTAGTIRFIPAWAGNTPTRLCSFVIFAVHPRMGGEHLYHALLPGQGFGSSPHGRGTRSGQAGRGKGDAVHPRMGGEHRGVAGGVVSNYGSSPHGRGTRPLAVEALLLVRFIPAWAGNTAGRWGSVIANAVHPRMGGEHSPAPIISNPTDGSSPHGRGTPWPFP